MYVCVSESLYGEFINTNEEGEGMKWNLQNII
jgi:hypothetical protein